MFKYILNKSIDKITIYEYNRRSLIAKENITYENS